MWRTLEKIVTAASEFVVRSRSWLHGTHQRRLVRRSLQRDQVDDKIVFKLKRRLDDDPDWEATEKHDTVQAGQNSGVIDIHETRSFPDGDKEHRTLFALRADDLRRLCNSFHQSCPR